MPIKNRKPTKKRSCTVKTTIIAPLKVTKEEKILIDNAAALSGQTISQFIINNILHISQNINKESLSPLLRSGKFQLTNESEVKYFSYIQMKIEDPNITPDYLLKS